jgi:hypothetical protein
MNAVNSRSLPVILTPGPDVVPTAAEQLEYYRAKVDAYARIKEEEDRARVYAMFADIEKRLQYLEELLDIETPQVPTPRTPRVKSIVASASSLMRYGMQMLSPRIQSPPQSPSTRRNSDLYEGVVKK